MSGVHGVRVLSRADGREAFEELDLEAGCRYGLGVSWGDVAGRSVDIDLQCVVVDGNGVIIDCAYYNNLKAARAVTHSGDENVGKIDSIREAVWVNFARLPANVHLLVFVVAAYSGGSLKDVTDGRLHVFKDSERNEVALFEMESSAAAVDIVATMSRKAGSSEWGMVIMDHPAQNGRHFMDILPLLGEVVRSFLPHAPPRQKVAFAMEKGGVMDLPQDLGRVTVGLGWDVDDGACDVDVSAVLLDGAGRDLEAVFFGRLESVEHGITHTGDNLTGEGDGDDEQIVVDLARIGPAVQQVYFVVNIYTQNRTFAQVANPYCRIVEDAGGSELCRYRLREAGGESGLIIAKVAREAGGRWGFHALGLPCRGRTYKDSLPHIRASCNLKTSSLMLRTSSSTAVTEAGPVASQAPPKSAACVLL